MNIAQSVKYIYPELVFWTDFSVYDYWEWIKLEWYNQTIPQPTEEELQTTRNSIKDDIEFENICKKIEWNIKDEKLEIEKINDKHYIKKYKSKLYNVEIPKFWTIPTEEEINNVINWEIKILEEFENDIKVVKNWYDLFEMIWWIRLAPEAQKVLDWWTSELINNACSTYETPLEYAQSIIDKMNIFLSIYWPALWSKRQKVKDLKNNS